MPWNQEPRRKCKFLKIKVIIKGLFKMLPGLLGELIVELKKKKAVKFEI